MNRVIVFLLAAFDALVTAAVGVVIALAPLTALWIFGFGGQAPWDALWVTTAKIWQLGQLVPLSLTLPADYLAAAGIDPGAATFTLSLAPLAFAAITAVSAARSGVRAASSGAAFTGALSGTVVFAAGAAAIALTSTTPIAMVDTVAAIAIPATLFAIPALAGAVAGEWRDADRGLIARVRDAVERAPGGWRVIPEVTVRSAAIAVVGLLGAGAALLAAAIMLRGSEIVGLYEASHVDLAGAVLLTIAHLLYLPTLVVWSVAFLSGPGVSLGAGSTISPSGSETGVLPGIPLLGVIPDSTTPWLLLLALVPVALGALAGWVARSALVRAAQIERPVAAPASWTAVGAEPADDALAREPVGPRLVATVAIAVLTAGAAAVLAVLASGSLGPGQLAHVGPEPGPVALAVGLEIALGAAILLLSPRPRRTRGGGGDDRSSAWADPAAAATRPQGASEGVSLD